jgi:ribosomal 50S subunit-associated protein YjgA (DUF615 family)
MKVTIETLRELVKKYPNNLELGDAIRKMVWSFEKDQEKPNKNQVTIFDVIREEDGKN